MPDPYKIKRRPPTTLKARGRSTRSGAPATTAKIKVRRPLQATGKSTTNPSPNPRAMVRANQNARFKREASGGLNPGKFLGEVGQNLAKGIGQVGKTLDSAIPQRRSTTISNALKVTEEQRRKLRQAQGK